MRNSDADMPMEHRIDGAGDAEQMADMPREPQIEEANEPEPMSRRELLRLGLAGVSAFALTRLGLGQIRLEPKPVPCQRLIADLPPDFTQALWTTVLRTDRRVQYLVSFFEGQGFRFIPQRIRAFMAVSSQRQPKPAGILVLAPSYKQFSPSEPSHDEWTIISLYNGCIHTVAAGGITINHETWKIASCQIIEFDPAGNPYMREVSREVLLRGPEAIAEQLGMPIVDPAQWDSRFGEPDQRSAINLSPALFAEWINDRYVRPLYPPGATAILLRDSPIASALVAANYIRYERAFQAVARCTTTCSTCSCSCCCRSD